MEKRLLFDGVNAEAAGVAVGQEFQVTSVALTESAVAGLPFAQFAAPGAEETLDLAIAELTPISRFERLHTLIMPHI